MLRSVIFRNNFVSPCKSWNIWYSAVRYGRRWKHQKKLHDKFYSLGVRSTSWNFQWWIKLKLRVDLWWVNSTSRAVAVSFQKWSLCSTCNVELKLLVTKEIRIPKQNDFGISRPSLQVWARDDLYIYNWNTSHFSCGFCVYSHIFSAVVELLLCKCNKWIGSNALSGMHSHGPNYCWW